LPGIQALVQSFAYIIHEAHYDRTGLTTKVLCSKTTG